MENGEKTDKIAGTTKQFTVETGREYELKIVVSGRNVKCYIDGELYIDYKSGSDSEAEVYHVVSTDESGDIIVKIVNVTDRNRTLAIDISDKNIADKAEIYQVKGDSLEDDNILGEKEDCIMEQFEINGFSNQFNYTVPKYSVTVIRLKQN